MLTSLSYDEHCIHYSLITKQTNEVKYSEFTVTGEIVTAVDLNTLVKLFTNHRPVFPVGKVL
jgi:hypothetical protein